MKHVDEARLYFGVRPYGWKRRAIKLFLRLMWARLQRVDLNRPKMGTGEAFFYDLYESPKNWGLDEKAEEDLRRLGRFLGYTDCNVAHRKRRHYAWQAKMSTFDGLFSKPYTGPELALPVKLSIEHGMLPA